jgi:hypothetical protein
MGGKYAHWDVLDARSNESCKAEKLLMNLSNTHFHAYAQHRDVLRGFCTALFETTTEPEINAVKLEAFGVDDGLPILRDPGVITGAVLAVDTDHPVMIALSKTPLPSCYTQRVLFEPPKCAGNVSTVLHNRTTPEQKKFSALIGEMLLATCCDVRALPDICLVQAACSTSSWLPLTVSIRITTPVCPFSPWTKTTG